VQIAAFIRSNVEYRGLCRRQRLRGNTRNNADDHPIMTPTSHGQRMRLQGPLQLFSAEGTTCAVI
jgi:hypothetical protein